MKRKLGRKERAPLHNALFGCAIGIAGICVGLFCFIPSNEHVGTLWTMFSAVVTGIFYTRYTRIKKEQKEKEDGRL